MTTTTMEVSETLERVDSVVNMLDEICDHMDGFRRPKRHGFPASQRRCALGAMSCKKRTKARKTREATRPKLTQDQWHKIKNKRQRLVLCRLVIDLMPGVHTAYASPASEPFGTRLETFFIGLCVARGHMDGKPFSVAKIAAYMRGATQHRHTQARSIAALGLNLSSGPSILPAR